MAKSAETGRTLVNRRGGELVTTMTDKKAFKTVEKIVEANPHQNKFAANLITTGKKHGLTDEQFWWIHKIAQMEAGNG
jgi:hypothetical protein